MSLDNTIYRLMACIEIMKARIRSAKVKLETEESYFEIQSWECLIHQLEMMIENYEDRIRWYITDN